MPTRPTTLDAGVLPTHVHVSVYEPDGDTWIADLTERSGLAWQETAAGEPGEGTVTVHADADVLNTYPTILRKRNVIKLRYDLDQDAFYAFRIKRSTEVIVDEGEDSARRITVSGPDILSWLDWGITMPEGGVRPESPADRSFGWMSATGAWFDSGNWVGAQAVVYGSSSLIAKRRAPYAWPDTTAYWIWPTDPTLTSPVGNAYFRKTFTLADETEVVFSASFDNAGEVWVDNMVLFGADDTRTWSQTYAVSLILSAGTHTLAAKVFNATGMTTLTGNPGGLIFAAHALDSTTGGRGALLFHSDTSWLTHLTDPPPGWVRAEILRQLLAEGQDRDAAGLINLTAGFTDTDDSHSDAWAAEDSVTTISVGKTVLEAQQQLSSLGSFDVWVDYENRVLHAAAERGLDLSSTITFARRVNLLRWQVDEEDEIRNSPLVRFDGGWVELTEPTSVSEWGRTETMLDIGSAQDADRAAVIAEAAYGVLANPQSYGQAGDQRVEEGKQPQGSLIATLGAVPWRDFFPGDYVTAYAAGNDTPVRAWIVSMSGSENDETGEITYDPELQDASGDFVKRPPLSVLARYLAKTETRFKGQDAVQPAYQTPSDYVYGGGYNTDAAPTKFASLARRPGTAGAYTYEDPDGSDPIYLEAIVADTAVIATNIMKPGFRAPRACTLREVTVDCDTAPGSGGLVVVLKRKSTGATLATITVTSGQTHGGVSGLTGTLTKGELIRVDVTAANGAKGVLVSIEAD